MLKVTLLYFPDCPNAKAARESIRAAIDAEKTPAEITEVDISGADVPAALAGWGSPTILFDGVDVAGGSPPTSAAVSCRVYNDGLPSLDQLRERIRAGSKRTGPTLSMIGAALAALGASACCFLPALLALMGALQDDLINAVEDLG